MTTSSVPIGDLFELEAVSKRIWIMHSAVIFAFVLISSEFYIIMWNSTICFRNSSLIKDNSVIIFSYLCGFKPSSSFYLFFSPSNTKRKTSCSSFSNLTISLFLTQSYHMKLEDIWSTFMILILWMADRWMEIAAYISQKSTFRETIILIMTGLIELS